MYHYLSVSMLGKYMFNQFRDALNNIFHIEPTPGAHISLKSDLLIKPNKLPSGSKVNRISNYVVLFYSLRDDNNVYWLTNKECAETYNGLKATCQPIFSEMLMDKGWTYNCFSRDIMFTGICSCPWGIVHKDIHSMNSSTTWIPYSEV